MNKVLLAAVFALVGGSFFSCSSSNDDEPFSMNERAITMQKGDKYTINHTGKASWSSDDDFVASVNDGEVTAIYVKYDNKKIDEANRKVIDYLNG